MKIVFTIVLLFFWSSIGAQVRPEHSGMWYNPDQDGHGLILEVLDGDRMAGFWFLYTLDGAPMWFLLQGDITTELIDDHYVKGSVIELESYVFHGMKMGEWDPATNERLDAGKVVVEFHDCNTITVTMTQLNMMGYLVDWNPIPMERLTHLAGMHCGGTSPADWPWTLAYIAAEPWTISWTSTSYTQPDIAIAEDGTFRYGGGSLLCEYEAQITIDDNDIFEVELSHTWSTNDGFCLAMYDDPAPGKVYQNYEVCIPGLVGEFCAIHDEALVFDTYEIDADGERVPSDQKVVLFRDF